ncbi:TadE-like protein [Bifidobacterium goeldii]|uniref:TadE-like protein n=2 Tax=Bifidobacterium goeldii TaxID=2306975 RepID=A0A430FL55_9BIFI|nr:Rv3654c family TadE-like protein [Bifidobacterium goeldii]RSX53633.1 TadE-like protein [Bifidobacterium goeldii]
MSWLQRSDEGSGTMLGVMLIMLAGVLMGVIAAAGNLLICQTKARSIADVAVISAADSFWKGATNDPCAIAQYAAKADAGSVTACSTEGDDVTVTVAVPTKVPFMPTVSQQSRAGPLLCDAEH